MDHKVKLDIEVGLEAETRKVLGQVAEAITGALVGVIAPNPAAKAKSAEAPAEKPAEAESDEKPVEKPKRTRRTKAQIEADKKAAAEAKAEADAKPTLEDVRAAMKAHLAKYSDPAEGRKAALAVMRSTAGDDSLALGDLDEELFEDVITALESAKVEESGETTDAADLF